MPSEAFDMFQNIHVPKSQAPFVPIKQFGKFDLKKKHLVSKEKPKILKKKQDLSMNSSMNRDLEKEKCKTCDGYHIFDF